MLWDFSIIADQIGRIIAQTESDLRLEQAVYGLDSRDEKQIQEMLAHGLESHHGVNREVHYPSTVGRKLTHRPRCDLVLSPKNRPLRLDSTPPTLFDPTHPCEPGEALWLEVKIAYQYREGNIRHTGYTGQWRGAVIEDLRKMEAESAIKEAGLLLIVFNESEEVLNKDLDLFENDMILEEVLAGFRQVRSIAILDRIGHRLCSVALWPTIQRD